MSFDDHLEPSQLHSLERHEQHNDALEDDDDGQSHAAAASADAVVDHADITVHSGDLGRIESPSCESLGQPAHCGWLMKRGLRLGCLPTWKRRWCVLQAAYIFKFEGPASQRPKGIPIPVLGVSCTLDPHVDPAGGPHCALLTVVTLRRDYTFGCDSSAELQQWIDAIARAKLRVIKQGLGHAPQSASEEFANASGDFLTQRGLDCETDAHEESTRLRTYE